MSDAGAKGISRRQLIGVGAGAVAAAALNWPAPVSARQQAGGSRTAGTIEELVLTNGRIHTMDAMNTVVNTVAINNGLFSAVGGAVPMPAAARRIIDLKGRTAAPGIIDNHNHIVLMGNRPGYHTPLENARSIRGVQETIAVRAKTAPRGAWITTIGGFHRNQFAPAGEASRMPSLAELDEAAPDSRKQRMVYS